jgi:hypothetical protein
LAKKKPKLVRVQLDGAPYESALFCPYCGMEILEPGGEEIGTCPHLIHADMEGDPEEAGEQEFRSNDLCFVLFEPPPAWREHYFVFREAGGDGVDEGVDDEDEDDEDA